MSLSYQKYGVRIRDPEKTYSGSRVEKAPDPESGTLPERNEPDLDENGLDPVEGAEVHRHVGEGLLLTTPASHRVQPSRRKKSLSLEKMYQKCKCIEHCDGIYCI